MSFKPIRYASAFALTLLLAACGTDSTAPVDEGNPEQPGTPGTPAPDVFLAGARAAWTYVENNTNATTGLASATETFKFATTWDIASQIGATYSAHELGIIDDANYDGRIKKILATLTTMPLFEGAAFNRFYDVAGAKMVRRDYTPSSSGFGWSTTDIGRLLIWLRVLAVNQPQYAAQATAVVNRLDYSKIISGGTLQGVDVNSSGQRSQYAETGLGYEQYAAGGFALWGKRASNSLNPTANARTTTVLGVTVWVDASGNARLLSEPYIMMGLETGFWASALRDQAQAVLKAQKARYDQQGIITIVTEDAMPEEPYKFYYYSVYHSGQRFVVEGPPYGSVVSNPRWVSSKATFAWHVLFPSDYTQKAFDAVQAAVMPGHGWGSGVYEGSLAPTGWPSLNTAGIILEAVAYRKLGKSFLSQPIS
jgi:uncharacterized protein DUF3131